ncbi:thiol:disulfide interchange protein DsbA/DsbL [Thiohalocapsa marina]|uniref:Thiol:disulfide interchange protein n=2 Tax=Thiohalocapsa marina TaxID=424902 RepID=A0A5M8FF05_9GAMM|nr:thiol:disulfide interchange protein DsbA/DsbL [Thiohalocapsa marina]
MSLALLVTTAATAATPSAAEFDEGIDYRRVEQPVRAEPGADVEVLELFWYGCPHCWHLEPRVQAWLENKPAEATFRRLPAAAAPHWAPHAKAYYAAEMLGELDRLHEPLFRAMHEERRRLQTDDALIAFAAEQGIDEAAFRNAYNSFPVDMQVRKSADLVRRYGVDGVPAVVVNGKYVTSASQAGSNERMFQVVDYLVDLEAGAPGAAAPE